MKRTLAIFADCCGGRLEGADAPFAGVVIDSRRLSAGDLFAALPGTRTDGHEFIAAAAASGAAAAIVSRPVGTAVPKIVVADVAKALSVPGSAWRAEFRGPLLAVAGSNGKTTTDRKSVV